MTLTLTVAQVIERCTVTLTVSGAASLPSAIIIIDGKAYTGLWTSGTFYMFSYDLPLERGQHIIYGQATDSAGTVTTSSLAYVMAYELTEYGIDVYSGDAKLDAIGTVLHDALLPDLPTLNFSCATLLTGNIGAVIRERGLRQYQFTIDTVAISGPLYVYTCLADESYALTSAIMALQIAYGSTADAIKLLVPSLNIVNVSTWVGSTKNLITNGNFGVDTTGWYSDGGTISEETAAPLVGAGSLKFITGGGYTSVICQTGGLLSGHTYLLTGLMKTTAAAGRKAQAKVWANNGSWMWQTGSVVDCSALTSRVSVTFTVTAVSGYLQFGLDSYVAGESFILDSVTCYDLTDIGNVNPLVQTTYPQLFGQITPVEVIDQLMIQALAQASVRNGNLYVFPLDVSIQVPDYHMQRLDPLTGWQRDADVYDAVQAHYLVKQYPTPDTFLTLGDAANWTGTVTDVTQVAATLLPVPSGATGMLKSVGNCSRAVSTLFRYFDRIRFNWCPIPTGATVTVSLQQDAGNKLELTHTFAGQIGAGFVETGDSGVPTETLTRDIVLDPVQFVTKIEGMTTANCSYRVTLLNASGILWQDAWRNTISNTFEANIPTNVSQNYQATMVRIEFTDLYLIGADYGVQCVRCYITKQVWTAVGSHQQVDSNIQYTVPMHLSGSGPNNYTMLTYVCLVPTLTGNQTYTATLISAMIDISVMVNGQWQPAVRASAGGFISVTGSTLTWYRDYGPLSSWEILSSSTVRVNVVVSETVQDYAWVSSMFVWSDAFNLFESLDLSFVDFVRTGNPVNLQTIALTFADDNYVDSLVLVADNPLPVTVRAGTGSRAFTVTDDFGSEAGAQAYANGLLPIVSVAREQYTRDVSLATDLGVGDTIDGDGKNFTVRSVDYRQDGKTIAAGQAMDILMERLKEQSRRLDALERKV